MNEVGLACDILFATPGRLKHFVDERIIKLEYLQIFVFDEGDHMLKSEFMEDLSPILDSKYFKVRTLMLFFFYFSFF